jgi:hypothetical protein
MELAKTVALGELGRELTGLVAGASWAGQAAVLGRARMLLEKLHRAPAVAAPTQEPAGIAAGWQAVRLADAAGQEEIVCWSEADDAQVRGQWRDGVLTGLWVQAGSDFWSSLAGPYGDTWASSAEETPGPGDQVLDRRLEERVRAAKQEVAQTRMQPGWVCQSCGWENVAEDARCRGCLAPHSPIAKDLMAAGTGVVGGMAATPSGVRGTFSASGAMEMPDGWQDLLDQLRDELMGKVTDGLKKAAEEGGTSAGKDKQAERTCVRCGKPMSATHRFCPVCGAEQPPVGATPK